MKSETCQRCLGKTNNITTMSIFNMDIICVTCKSEEKKHPKYKEAVDAEYQEVKKGNYNFPGIGYPMGLETGQIGVVKSRFSNSESKMKIVSFTDSGQYMRCIRIDISDKAPKRIKDQLFLFSTSTMIQKGSHMGNTKIYFD